MIDIIKYLTLFYLHINIQSIMQDIIQKIYGTFKTNYLNIDSLIYI